MGHRTGMPTITQRELNRATLARQGLLARWDDADAVEALRRVAGLQAQEPRPPFVGLWTRLENFAADDLLAALRDRRAVRATLMRGTLHTVAAEDWPLFFGPPDRTRNVLGTRSRDLDPEPVLVAAEALLREHGPMSFNTLRPLLAERFPDEDHRVLGYVSRILLPLVMEPTEDRWGYGRDPLFGLAPDPWPATPDRAEVVRRYLAALGPATVDDAQTWSGLQGLRPVVEDLRDELVSFEGEDGRELFDLPDAPRPPADTPGREVVLLPDFDNLLLAHKDRRRVIADEHRPLVATKNLRIKATFLLDGVVAGTWSIKATKTKATVTLEPFGNLTKRAARTLADEAERAARFLEPTVTSVNVRSPSS